MLDDPKCPVCDCSAWKSLAKRKFVRGERAKREYVNRRLRVLFEVWVPHASHFVAELVLCRRCGFVCFRPRPTLADIAAKYGALAGKRVNRGVRSLQPLDRERSSDFYQLLSPHLGKRREMLDFGGGSGSLLISFLEHGIDCSIVEYARSTIEGVTWLGNTLEELPPDRRFDIVLASHVFEHLADPLETARSLRSVLRDQGLICVEVPLELQGAPPRLPEPLSHVNFFCPTSLRVLLQRAGFRVVVCEQQVSRFADGVRRPCVRAIAQVAARPEPVSLPGSTEARRLLGLRLRDRIVAQPRSILTRARRTLGRPLKLLFKRSG